jgi:dUTP pyrophosphatase
MKEVTVYIEICREDVKLPQYANLFDAGMDISAAEDVKLFPTKTVIIPTGLKVAIPEGYEIQVRPRSGLSLKTPLRIANAPGTIDTLFRDEIGIIVTNTDGAFYNIKKGDRIAQLVLNEIPRIRWEQVDNITTIKGNRGGGFGSTGVKT